MKKENIKLLIFDFDGTIVDSKSLYYKVIGDELRILGFSKKKIDMAIDIGTSLRKTLRNIGFGFIVSWWLHKKILKRIEKYIPEVKKCHDAEKIKNISARKILVTNSLKEFAVPVLRHLKLEKEFAEIYGADDFSDKVEFISEYIKNHNIDKKNVFYIGDRAVDVKLARKIGIISVIVSGKCAWNTRKEILAENPDFLLSDLDEISEIILS
ncbi:HAD family hydrolase [Candidatus Pacearchaeota archaeon]|nr:HAD family hydrolase [Candidatus Pacearchaeota archaeon]